MIAVAPPNSLRFAHTETSEEDPRLRVRGVPLVAVALLLLAAVALLAPLASAAQTRPYTGVSFGPDGAGGTETFKNIQSVAVDRDSGEVFVYDGEAGTISKFDSSGTPADFSGLGTNVIEGVGTLRAGETGESQIAVAPSGSPGGTAGDIYLALAPGPVQVYAPDGSLAGSFAAAGAGEETCGVAVDPDGHVFVGLYPSAIREYVPSADPPIEADLQAVGSAPIELCNVGTDGASNVYAAAFVGSQIAVLEGIGDTSPTFITPGARTISADAVSDVLYADRGNLVAEYKPTGALLGTFGEELLSNSAGVAVNASNEKAYVGDNGSGTVRIFGEAGPQLRAKTEQATSLTQSGAVLQGSIDPEGAPLDECFFQWGPTSSAIFGNQVNCTPSAAEIPPDSTSHAVSAALENLQPNTAYRFRLVGANAFGKVVGQTLTFTTVGAPQIREVRAANADQTSVSIEATIDPRGSTTNYYVEWGPTSGYGQRLPVSGFEPSVGSGQNPVPISVRLDGLSQGTTYHYRVVAKSNSGTTTSQDHELETLNACELPEGRCFEMVSPRDAGPIALPSRAPVQEEMQFQAGQQPGLLAYSVYAGLPGATRGGTVLYRASRGAGDSGWTSSQIAPPILVRNETDGTQGGPLSIPSITRGISQDLGCALFESNQPLTSDATTRPVVEAGGVNLFRRNPDGSYTAITNLPPVNLDAVRGIISTEYAVAGFSQNCSKVVFSSNYRYAGVPALPAGGEGTFLYEWDEGSLRNVGSVPGSSGEVLVGAVPGGVGLAGFGIEDLRANFSRSVSTNGSRVFFTAVRQTSENPAEVGKIGVFVRENGSTTRDVSMSETGTADEGAKYQGAAEDGSRVFFTANAGLTSDTSAKGIDLYEYDLSADALTDLSVDHDPGGAGVAGYIGSSADGSHVYFVARGQLVPGQGSSFEENQSNGTFSVYEVTDGVVSYVGRVTNEDASTAKGLIRGEQKIPRSGFVSPDGNYLLFQSSANVTGYDSGGVPEAYLYSSVDELEPTVCVSCRQDGRPSVTTKNNSPLVGALQINVNELYENPRLVMRGGKPVVFFTSLDRLAPGASEGEVNLGRTNLYEWTHDQVFLITTEPPGLKAILERQEWTIFGGASANAEDLYFATPSSLTWEDGDGRLSVYDARIGGGFPPPAPQSPSCNPITEGSCSGPSIPAPPASPNAGTATFTGPGNKKAKKHKKSKKHKKHQKKKQGKNHKKKKQSSKNVGKSHGDRRASK